MPVTRARLNLLRLTTLTFLYLRSSAINEQGSCRVMRRAEGRPSVLLGSAGSLPAVFGSLPANAGWQPALPGVYAFQLGACRALTPLCPCNPANRVNPV